MNAAENPPSPLYKGEYPFLPFERGVSSIRSVILIVNYPEFFGNCWRPINLPVPLNSLRKSIVEWRVFLSSLRDCGFLVHPFPAMNRWAIIVGPYGTGLSINTRLVKNEAYSIPRITPILTFPHQGGRGADG